MNELTVISEKEKTQLAWKKFFMFALLFACAVTPIFAQDATGIDGAVSKVTTFLSSGAITAVCLIALVVEAIGVVVMGKQGADVQSIISKFSPWVVGTVVLLSANGICNYFLADLSFGD
ncbi:MAG: TrbC/VirB2 family protein [Treponema sp.]|nr:TrbC/VirB2 family protein [Treponema sp.]